MKINRRALGWTCCLAAVFHRCFHLYLTSVTSTGVRREGERKRNGAWNLLVMLHSPSFLPCIAWHHQRKGIWWLFHNQIFFVESSSSRRVCACIMERLAIAALVISGGIRRLMKWGELMSPPTPPARVRERSFRTYRRPFSFGCRWPFGWSSVILIMMQLLIFCVLFQWYRQYESESECIWPVRSSHSEYHRALYPRIPGNAPQRLSVRLDYFCCFILDYVSRTAANAQ